jgi:uncharacterized protein YwbE
MTVVTEARPPIPETPKARAVRLHQSIKTHIKDTLAPNRDLIPFADAVSQTIVSGDTQRIITLTYVNPHGISVSVRSGGDNRSQRISDTETPTPEQLDWAEGEFDSYLSAEVQKRTKTRIKSGNISI